MPEVVPPNIKPVAEGDIFSRLFYPTAAALALMLGEGCATYTNTGALTGVNIKERQLSPLLKAEREAADLAHEREHALNVAHSHGMNNVVYLASNGELSTSFKEVFKASGTTQGLHSVEMTVRENGSELNLKMRDLELWKDAQRNKLRERPLLGVLFDLSGKVVDPNNPNIKFDPVEPFISTAKHGAVSNFIR